MNQLFIYEWLQVKVILCGNETRWQVGSIAGQQHCQKIWAQQCRCTDRSAKTRRPPLTHAVALFVFPQTLTPFQRHLVPEWLNYNTQQNISCRGADWSSRNCNLDSYFYAISFVNDADSAALSLWIAAAWKQALPLSPLTNGNTTTMRCTTAKAGRWEKQWQHQSERQRCSVDFCCFAQFCYRCIERTPTRPLTFKKNENKDQRGGQAGTQNKPPQTSNIITKCNMMIAVVV